MILKAIFNNKNVKFFIQIFELIKFYLNFDWSHNLMISSIALASHMTGLDSVVKD